MTRLAALLATIRQISICIADLSRSSCPWTKGFAGSGSIRISAFPKDYPQGETAIREFFEVFMDRHGLDPWQD